MGNEKQKCFVLMPFESLHEKYYAKVYARAIEDANLDPVRADSLFRPSPIVGDIWKFVQESVVLLADLTGRNPNVFYELGLAHAIGKPVVLVAATMEDVPFDLRGLRVITFDRSDPDWGATLRECITVSLKETLADILGAVPGMFIQGTPPPPSSPKESALEVQVRALAEEITALRRENNSRRAETNLDAMSFPGANIFVNFRKEPAFESLQKVIDIAVTTFGTPIRSVGFKDTRLQLTVPGGHSAHVWQQFSDLVMQDPSIEGVRTLEN